MRAGAEARRLVRRALAATVGVVLATLLAGCAPLFVACSMPDNRPPHITIAASPWLQLHPGGTVHACYAGSCDDEDGTRPSFEVLAPRTLDLRKEHDLDVTLDDQTSTTRETAQVALQLVPGQKGAACPMPDQWSRQVLIAADGRLQVGGADYGSLLVPTPAETPGP